MDISIQRQKDGKRWFGESHFAELKLINYSQSITKSESKSFIFFASATNPFTKLKLGVTTSPPDILVEKIGRGKKIIFYDLFCV